MKISTSPSDMSAILFESHEVGAVARGSNTKPCSICRNTPEFPRLHFHGSDIGICARKLYYKMTTESDNSGFNSMQFLLDGTMHESQMLKSIEAGLPDQFKIVICENGAEEISELLGFKLVTHCDAFLVDKTGDKIYVLECKSIKPKYFKEIKDKEEIRDEWYGQLQSYLFANKCETGIFVIKNREDSKIMFPISINKDVAYMGKRIGKLSEVFTSIKNDGTIPAREHRTDKDFECTFCAFKKDCWSV